MKRREFIAGLAGAAAWPAAVRAQQTVTPVIGFLDSGYSGTFAERVASFRRGLSEAGYIEGQNVRIEFRWAEGHYERLPGLAAELVRQAVTILVATGSPNSARAAQAATDRIPIVFTNGGDPVRDGLVASLSRPARNLTGISYSNSALVTKRLEFLLELLPAARRVGFIVNPSNPNAQPDAIEMIKAGQSRGVEISVLEAHIESDLARIFATGAQQSVDGVIVNNDVFLRSNHLGIVNLARAYRIPTIYASRDWAIAGGLLAYGSEPAYGYWRAGTYVGRILKGEKPADLPVELSSKIELVINLKTAKSLGLSVPQTLLVSADEVIQ